MTDAQASDRIERMLRAEIERLTAQLNEGREGYQETYDQLMIVRQKVAEAAAFLDALADRLYGFVLSEEIDEAAFDCRAMAKRWPGRTCGTCLTGSIHNAARRPTTDAYRSCAPRSSGCAR